MTARDEEPTGWCGRRVLVTGHTGFKGAWLSLWLERLGATVSGLALLPSDPAAAIHALAPRLNQDLETDIRDREGLAQAVDDIRPEIVFHLAAQALVPASYRDPIGTYETNVLGTVNVLAASIDAGVKAVVVITSDKVYANDDSGRAFVETDMLGGRDPYSASKACADLAAQSWRTLPEAGGTAIAIARAGNVIGGGDVAPERLLPDVHRALLAQKPVVLRRPEAVRPWQFVLEPLSGYLSLGARLLTAPILAPVAVNLGPALVSCRAVHEVVNLAHRVWGGGSWLPAEGNQPAEAPLLTLDSTLAANSLEWRPRLDLETAVEWTVGWWRAAAFGDDLRTLALDQISAYEARIHG